MTITGLGPHGERAVPADQIHLSEADCAAAEKRRFSVAVVLHTTTSDWSRQELAGIATVLGRASAAVVEVVDCGFDAAAQIAALRRLSRETLDAVISIPIGNAAVAEAHRAVSAAGIKLVLLDNAPTGLLPGTDYVSVVSADNFGLGQMAAKLLSAQIGAGATAGILTYGADFYATREREIAFRKWMAAHRPEIGIAREKFVNVTEAGAATSRMIADNPGIGGLFVAWDVPAMAAVRALRQHGLAVPVTTVDLGNDVAAELASGGLIKGVAAQRPYDQGVAAGATAILALIGKSPPAWIALSGVEVVAANVVEAYQMVWHAPAPKELMRLRRKKTGEA